MFISKEEKNTIQTRLNGYAKITKEALIDITNLKARVAELEKKPVTVIKVAKKPLSALQKAKQRVYQMEYKQRVKAQKLAQQGKTNVSA